MVYVRRCSCCGRCRRTFNKGCLTCKNLAPQSDITWHLWCLGFLFPIEEMPDRDGLVLPMFQSHTSPQLSLRSVTCAPCHSFIPKVSTEHVAILLPFKDNFLLCA